MAILDENEFTEVEGRYYANPQVALDESNTFIDNLRDTQQTNNQQIQTDTYNLGTEVPSNLGGLTGGESYFTSRYQTPQTASAVSDLRATAQAAALNQALSNEEAIWKKRYNDAYKAYQKRSWDKTSGDTTKGEGDISEDETTTEVGSVTTEGIMKSMYENRFLNYKKQGMSTVEAEAKAKADLGVANIVNNEGTAKSNNIERKKSSIGGDNAYVYTLPNGHTVLVDEGTSNLIITSTGYAIINRETGHVNQVGG